MQRDLSALDTQGFDLLIIGGGITGACIAFDAVLRGMSVALVEKDDFGAATSSASSKLLHGGIRYLQQGRLQKVRESALERTFFQSLAPHLSRYVPFVIPTYKGIRKGKVLLRPGMWVYEALCLGQNRHIRDESKDIPSGRSLSKEELARLIPSLRAKAVTGGILFYESHMQNSERTTLAFLETAARKGAILANYLRASVYVVHGSKVIGIKAEDQLCGGEIEIRASVVVNAAGPWIPQLNAGLGNHAITGLVTGFSKGAHIVVPPITNGYALALPTRRRNQGLINRGGRHIFIIPWRQYSLIGTTYGPYQGNLDEVKATEDDIAELVEDINSAFGAKVLTRSDVVYAYAGIYPLIDDEINPKIYQGTGDYQVIDHIKKDGLEGLVTVFGAKYTTARLLAEKALNRIVRKLDKPFDRCRTRQTPLAMGDIPNLEGYRREKVSQYASTAPPDFIDHLITSYGTDIDRVLALTRNDPRLAVRLSPARDELAAQVVYAVRHEMARHLEDVIFRRTGLGTLGNPGDDVLMRCAELMGNELGWNEAAREAEIRRVKDRFINDTGCLPVGETACESANRAISVKAPSPYCI